MVKIISRTEWGLNLTVLVVVQHLARSLQTISVGLGVGVVGIVKVSVVCGVMAFPSPN